MLTRYATTACLILALSSQSLFADTYYAKPISSHSSSFAPSAFAGIGFQSYDYRLEQSDTLSPTVMHGYIGAEFAPNLAWEFRYGVGLGNSEVVGENSATTVDFDQYHAVYLKPQFKLNDGVIAYGLIGYADVDWIETTSIAGIDLSQIQSDYGASIGFGGELSLSPEVSATVEYLRLLDEEKVDASSIGVGLQVKF